MRRRQVYAARAAAERAASVLQQPEAALPLSVIDVLAERVAHLEPLNVPQDDPSVSGYVVVMDKPARKKPGPKPGSKRKH